MTISPISFVYIHSSRLKILNAFPTTTNKKEYNYIHVFTCIALYVESAM